tara:strand:- start:76 stop:1482 length:1407 start_codon:yes stop_codon:yes gene_type:complete
MNNAISNVGLGFNALTSLTSGDQNLALGTQALNDVNTGSDNVAIGTQAGFNLTSAQHNIAIGTGAMLTATDTSKCVIIGRNAGDSINSSDSDGTVCIGFDSGQGITSGIGNTAVGFETLKTEDNGDRNTAIGYKALTTLNVSSGHGETTAVGFEAGADVSTGTMNTFVGSRAGNQGTNDITTGSNNTMIGKEARGNASSASNQTVIGASATGQADNSVTLGNADVTAVYMAQDSGATIYASNGVFVDDTSFVTVRDSSSYSAGTGGGVAFQGLDSDGNLKQFSSTQGYSIGSNNGGLAIYTRDGGSNNLAVIVDNNRAVKPGANDAYDIGTSSLRWDDIFATNGTIDTSDERRKENIKDTSLGLDFVNKLKPKEYKWKDYDYEHINNQDGEEPKSITKTRTFKRKHQGLLAQDVEKTLKDIGLTNDDFAGIVYDEESDIYGLRYSQLIAPLIKAVQELSVKVTELENK